MFKRVILIIIILVPLKQKAQDFSSQWDGYFSYNNIKEVIKGGDKVYAAADNAIFSLDIQTNELEELTTINGLSGETISTIYYSELYELLVIGYENGLIEIVFDNGDDVLSVVDIIEKPTIPSTDKRINHFNAYQNIIYISTNYGISIFNLERLEFGDTYFIGNNGSQIQVNQTVVFGDNIYAACSNGGGIRRAQVSNPNLIDFQNWQIVFSGDFLFVEEQNSILYAINASRRIYNITNDTLSELFLYNDTPLDVKSVDQYLVVTAKSNVFVYDENFLLVSQVMVESEFSTEYTSAIIYGDSIYIGTEDFGVLKTTISNPGLFDEIHPSGPLLNSPFSIETNGDNLWLVFGGYSSRYGWSGGRRFSGISYYLNDDWGNITYDALASQINSPQFLSHIAINPQNTNQVFISSYYSGLIEINENNVIDIFNQNNSTITPFFNDFYLTSNLSYDRQGALWLLNGRVNEPLNKFVNGNWRSFDFSSLIPDQFSNLGFSNITFDFDNNLFFGSFNYGLIGFKENNGSHDLKNIIGEDENMPSNNVTATALDNRNQLWIGTDLGLRVLYNTSNFFTEDDVKVDEVIILEDGIAKELLFQQFITDIKVDGSNNKWVGTADSGIFYLSSNGQKTIFHFTKDNSPLPSNTINDISLDDSAGIVYIATSRGLVSFKSGGSSPNEDLVSAHAYPNPVRPSFDIVEQKVKIKGVSENVNIKITDIEGNLVAEAQSRTNLRYRGYNLEIDGGTAYWNGKNLANNVVASGVYLIMLSDLDTFETRVLKLMVVR